MNIKIDETYSLKSDLRNVMLVRNEIVKAGKTTGEKREVVEGYYGDVKHALKDYLRIKTNLSEATTIKQLLADIEEIKATIEKVLESEDD